jgi:predicted nucleotidyltransferase
MGMLSAQEQAALGQFARALRARFGERLQQLCVFGSRARGEGRGDSDPDVFVRFLELSRTDVGLATGLVLSPLLADAAAWRFDLPLGQAIEREGLAL